MKAVEVKEKAFPQNAKIRLAIPDQAAIKNGSEGGRAGYDAIRRKAKKAQRLSIKGRCILPGSSRSQRLGKIDIEKPFDAVLMVLMDEGLNAAAIYEAPRSTVIAAPHRPRFESKERTRRARRVEIQGDRPAGVAGNRHRTGRKKMNEQERKIIGLLLNEMAFEGAEKHFHEEYPDIAEALLAKIETIEIPQQYDGNTESYQYVHVMFAADATVYEKCYKYLRIIRNNIIHANKAYRPDTPQRLTDLLDWAHSFIAAVYETGSPFAQRAQEIKAVMEIESF